MYDLYFVQPIYKNAILTKKKGKKIIKNNDFIEGLFCHNRQNESKTIYFHYYHSLSSTLAEQRLICYTKASPLSKIPRFLQSDLNFLFTYF